ncbi:MAG: HYR domain-containing protein [Fulvivirga sp.]
MSKHFRSVLLSSVFILMASAVSNSAPIITLCPSDITHTITTGCDRTATWVEPLAVDVISGIKSFTSTHDPGDTFEIGRTTVVYTAINNDDEVSTCTFIVNIKPSAGYALANCPSDVTLNVNAGCNRAASWVAPTVPCSEITLSSDYNPGDIFPIGTTTVTYIASKGVDIYAICMFDVTVNDNIAPTFDVTPGDITVAASADCEAIASWNLPTVLDNCTDNITPIGDFDPGATFPIGTTLVTYSASDEAGNPATYSFNVTVEDQTGPVFTNLPANRTVSASAVNCKGTTTWPTVIATDNCTSNVSDIVFSHASGSAFDLGITEVTYTATDDEGNETIESFNVTVVDNTDPEVVTCPGNVNVVATAGCTAVATWTAPTFDDACDISLSVSSSHSSGSTFDIGSTTITYTATDDAGNQTTCSFDVIVTDNTPPVLMNCPTNITVVAGANCTAVASWMAPTVFDNCSSSITPTADFSPGDTFDLGTTIVTYTAVDEAGNDVTCSFNVIVEDQTGPVFTNFPDNRTVTVRELDCKGAATWDTVTATDLCNSPVIINQSHASGDLFNLGETEVTYTATDDEGNETVDSFIVTVVDNTPPVITNCPSDINLTATNSCTAVATWSGPAFNDSCDATPSITRSHTSGTSFPIGTTSVTIIATDEAGNQTACTFNVTVSDIVAPVFNSCPSNITVATTGDGCEATATWTVPTASDNCTSDIVPTSDFEPGDAFPFGTTVVTYTAVDISGNEATCSFNVIVEDQTAPVLTGCPEDIEVAADASCGAVATWTPPTASDNCDSSLTITESHASGSTFDLGTTTVTYIATDAAGNETSCSFNVIVVDQAGPEVANCPVDIEITTAECEAVVNWEALTAVDNCSTVTTSSNFSPGDTFALGTTSVVYTFTDDLGNESQCSFNVTVVNPDALQLLNCPDDISVETDDSGRAEVSWAEPSVESICTNFTTSQSHQPGDTFQEGTTLVTYQFTDEFQAVVTCSFNVTVSIRDIEFDIPKLLTPNNDGNNDTWVLEGIENFPDNEVVVVDRWGGEIFKTTGYDNQRVVWDGTNQNGKIVPTGTYFFYISVKTNSSTQKTQGFIEIIQ